jgi:opacity protein-like surface antigen
MTKRTCTLALLATLWMVPATASAQIRQVSASSGSGGRQTVNLSVGYFALRGLESRPHDDVLLQDIQSAQPLLFGIGDLNSVPFGGEYLLGLTRNIEFGVGLSYSQRTAHTVYANLTHNNDAEIAQDLKLKQLPVSFTGRYLFLPRGSAVEPYIGAGIVAIRYKYSEVGEFVDANDLSIFPARYLTDGTVAGPTVLGGIRGLVGRWAIGGEVRWQKAVADVPVDQAFLGTKLDLGGWTGNFTFGVRF